MPELPEVETTRRGILPHIEGQLIEKIEVRQANLRWPVPTKRLCGMLPLSIKTVHRRAKYLLFETDLGYMILHLGMSGSLRMVASNTPPNKHDHIDWHFSNGLCMRFHDPRRFGACLWTNEPLATHRLLQHLGPEPLSSDFSGRYLHRVAQQRKKTVKEFVMDQQIVVGVGNIYAQEALFAAGIHPKREAGKISLPRYTALVEAIKHILTQSIKQGGTTLRDFIGGDGKPGYFKQSLQVYGREGQPCNVCGAEIRHLRLGNRASCFCGRCQR